MLEWVVIGAVVALALGLAPGEGSDGDGAGGDGEGAGGTGSQIRDGMSAAEVRELLQKAADRADKQRKSEIAKLEGSLNDRVAAAVAEEAERAKKDATELALEDRKKAIARAEAAEQRAAEAEARAERAAFIAANGGTLDKAWRVYLDGQLAAAGDDESPEDVLARVMAEHAEETGQAARPPGSVGTGGRPAPQTTPSNINDRIRRAAGR